MDPIFAMSCHQVVVLISAHFHRLQTLSAPLAFSEWVGISVCAEDGPAKLVPRQPVAPDGVSVSLIVRTYRDWITYAVAHAEHETIVSAETH